MTLDTASGVGQEMQARAVILERPGLIRLGDVATSEPRDIDIVVAIDFTAISTGTERLLWSGRMPKFPGLGYPLVPGYEAIGTVIEAGPKSGRRVGDFVFVPGTSRYTDVKGLFGGAASRLVVEGARVIRIDRSLGSLGTLMALAATACHVLAAPNAPCPELIVGHGVLGRLLARVVLAAGGPPPVVWETNPARRGGAEGYSVISPDDDQRHDYRSIVDMSGDPSILDVLVSRVARGGEIVLAGFYDERLAFDYVPAFMREAHIRISAEWQPADLSTAQALVSQGRLSLNGLVSDCRSAADAEDAYRIAFTDPACLKMLLDWRTLQ